MVLRGKFTTQKSCPLPEAVQQNHHLGQKGLGAALLSVGGRGGGDSSSQQSPGGARPDHGDGLGRSEPSLILEEPAPKACGNLPLTTPSQAVGFWFCWGSGGLFLVLLFVGGVGVFFLSLRSYSPTIKRLKSPWKFTEKNPPQTNQQTQKDKKQEAFSASPSGCSRHGLGCRRGSPSGDRDQPRPARLSTCPSPARGARRPPALSPQPPRRPASHIHTCSLGRPMGGGGGGRGGDGGWWN